VLRVDSEAYYERKAVISITGGEPDAMDFVSTNQRQSCVPEPKPPDPDEYVPAQFTFALNVGAFT